MLAWQCNQLIVHFPSSIIHLNYKRYNTNIVELIIQIIKLHQQNIQNPYSEANNNKSIIFNYMKCKTNNRKSFVLTKIDGAIL